MYKYITCPECGSRICRADYGSKVEIPCNKCRAEIKAAIDGSGVVHLKSYKIDDTHKTRTSAAV